MAEWFGFTTVKDLKQKLGRDLEKLRRDPTDADVAFNFFITAWSLVDWAHPRNRKAREALRSKHPVLQACAHLADGSKHLELDNPKHRSVVGTPRGGNWAKRPLRMSPGRMPVDKSALFVHLEGAAAKAFGEFPSALEVADATFVWVDKNL
jgi:hypothetical protein